MRNKNSTSTFSDLTSGVGRSLKVGGGGGGGGANYDGCEGLINNLGRYSNS